MRSARVVFAVTAVALLALVAGWEPIITRLRADGRAEWLPILILATGLGIIGAAFFVVPQRIVNVVV